MPPSPKPTQATTSLRLTISLSHRMAYRIGRGEQGVLTYEPYKSSLLPLWRFRTEAVARRSAAALWARFEAFDADDDFVGMDMARKFLQMGMTRAKRYANHAGGRKYKKVPVKARGDDEGACVDAKEELPRSLGHEGKEEKDRASAVFRDAWERCRAHEGYRRRKEAFIKEQKAWIKEHKNDPDPVSHQVD